MEFEFTGEESARFARFGNACLAEKVEAQVHVIGREPLTSRPVTLVGPLVGAKLEGYLRYIEIREQQSGLLYWVAGSNATRSIAARRIVVTVDDAAIPVLQRHGERAALHVPRLRRFRDAVDELLWRIEGAAANRNADGLRLLLEALAHPDAHVRLEAALTLRSFSSFVVDSGRRQAATAKAVLAALAEIPEWETRAALAEDLGYFGGEESVARLSSLLGDASAHDHVRWASAIALGRLPGVEPASVLTPGLTSEHEWTKAATLLSMARQASYSAGPLEAIFRNYLGAAHTPLMTRYACLGLSKLSRHDDATTQALAAVLGDDALSVSVRGYAALALASGLSRSGSAELDQVRQILGGFSRLRAADMSEPEVIWGIEFLAELASLLEQTEVSTALHSMLADYFDDWRADYYTCLKFYEKAEASVRRGLGDEAIVSYQQALTELLPIVRPAHANSLASEERATVQFRYDIVEARLKLQALLGEWLESGNTAALPQLVNALQPIRQTYRQYGVAGVLGSSERQLIERELSYLRNTAELVSVIAALVALDYRLRATESDADVQKGLLELDQIADATGSLEKKFEGNFAQSLQRLLDVVTSSVRAIGESLRSEKLPLLDKLRLARKSMTQIRSAFWKASWPMPARACPVYGLGRATIGVRREGMKGTGTEADPLMFPHGGPVVVPLSVRVFEMAPGGSTSVALHYRLGASTGTVSIPIVEDQYSCSIHVADSVPTYTAVQLDCTLVFTARDCQQQADNKQVFIRSEPK